MKEKEKREKREEEQKGQRPSSKPKGWFSSKHQTSDRHREASQRNREKYNPDRRFERAGERQEARDARTSEEQLRRLDERLGVGVGAKKERAYLQAFLRAKS